MKKIGIDARLYSQTGVGTYLRNFLHYLDSSDLNGKIIYVYLMDNDYDKASFRNKAIIKRRANYHWHGFGEQLGFVMTLYSDNLDLMHFTYFSYPILYFKPFISTVHDITPLTYKTGKASTRNPFVYQVKHWIFRLVLRNQLLFSKSIITPTATVKNELIKIYGQFVKQKILVIGEGVNYEIKDVNENKSLKKRYKDFFIYVGNFYPHKNVGRLIEAFSNLKTSAVLILIGPDDYFYRRFFSRRINRKVQFVKSPSLANLVYFYKNAKALIHPSLSEGFGLPLIEAVFLGCPIIASDIPVFQEILKGRYLSFDPQNSLDIKDKIESFLVKPASYDYRSVLKKYSFEEMTKKNLSVYNLHL